MTEESKNRPIKNVGELLATLIAEGYPNANGDVNVNDIVWFDEPDGASIFEQPPSLYVVLGHASAHPTDAPTRLMIKASAKDLFDTLRWVCEGTPVAAHIDGDDDLIFNGLLPLAGIATKVPSENNTPYAGNFNE